ncbi:hypothetical protein IFR04_014611 [Cadophora malorum]|uniref:Uncharacterized protein n=1 Tax=Cadophora malorum TaxID=108018 RepID=A0A8H7T4J8_9HELO|nr:hypothetical protein IFR04_014611 [Cadophora malorum]
MDTEEATGNQKEPGATIIMCEGPNCKKAAAPGKAPSTKHLCFMCDLIEKARFKSQLPPPKPKPVPRPIRKTKLYHVRPDDRPLVTNKRKRSLSGYASSTRAEVQRAPAPRASAGPTKTAVPGTVPRGPVRDQARKQKPEAAFDRRVSHNPSLPATLVPPGESPVVHTGPSHSIPSLESSESQKLYRNFLPVEDSPPHGSGMYQVNDDSNSRDDDLPTGQAASSPIPVAADMLQSPPVAPHFAEQLPPLEPTIIYPDMPSQDSPLAGADVDDEMLDAVAPARLSPARHSFPQPPSPLSNSSPHLSSPESPNFDDDIEQADTTAAIEPDLTAESSQESTLLEMITEFDESELDWCLQKQSQRDPFYEPNPTELLETQIWGIVDPRTVWPQRLSAAQKEQKIREIEARGGRKKNFGKILHPRLVQERSENGWDIHQSREKRDDEETTELTQGLAELFAVPVGLLGNCKPKSINGRLVMQEREREPEPRRPGRQKKEVPLGVFPVYGGQ